jgi:hypothetical protein
VSGFVGGLDSTPSGESGPKGTGRFCKQLPYFGT